MLKFAVFVSGGGTDLQSIIDAKNEGKINGKIALVLSNRQKAYGLQRAKDAGIETAVVKKDDALIVKMLKERNIDFIVLAGYLAILTDELIDAYPNKIMNIHPSLIPSFSCFSKSISALTQVLTDHLDSSSSDILVHILYFSLIDSKSLCFITAGIIQSR